MCFGAEWSFLPSLISANSYDQACLKLACRLLYRAGLDHMINLQGRFVEIETMGQAIWASCGILCIFGQPNNMRSRWWKADLHEPSSPTVESAAWVEGRQGTHKSVAINDDVLPRTPRIEARLLVKRLARDPATCQGVAPSFAVIKRRAPRTYFNPTLP